MADSTSQSTAPKVDAYTRYLANAPAAVLGSAEGQGIEQRPASEDAAAADRLASALASSAR